MTTLKILIDGKEYISAVDAARMLGITRQAIHIAASRGHLTLRTYGPLSMVAINDIDRYRRHKLGKLGRPKKDKNN